MYTALKSSKKKEKRKKRKIQKYEGGEPFFFFLLQWALKDLQDGVCEQKALFKGRPLRCSESKTLRHQTNIYSHLQWEAGGWGGSSLRGGEEA